MQKRLSHVCQVSPLLPILIGALTVTTMFAANSNRGLNWGMLIMPLIMVVCWAVLWWLLFFVIPKARGLSAVMASLFVLITMLWGVFPQLPQRGIMTFDMIPFMAILVGGMLIALYRRKINRASPVMVVVVFIAIMVSVIQAGVGVGMSNTPVARGEQVVATGGFPDIYFIVPDRFCSLVGLEESGLDTSEFVGKLRSSGFYVREDSLSADPIKPDDRPVDTTRTLRYLSSVFNMGEPIDLHISYSEAGKMVRNPEVVSILHSMGYTYYNIGSWWPETAISRVADYNYVYVAANPIQRLYTEEFGAAVLDRSILRYAQATSHQTERDRVMFQRDSVESIATEGESPKFVFAHILMPHPPYVWTADGKPQESNGSVMFLYLDQVQFTEGYLTGMVDWIQAKDSSAIIIIQSDEGICFTNPKDNAQLSNNQFNGVLTAWCVPGVTNSELEDIDPKDILAFLIGRLRS